MPNTAPRLRSIAAISASVSVVNGPLPNPIAIQRAHFFRDGQAVMLQLIAIGFGKGPLTTLTDAEMAAIERSLGAVLGMG